MLMKISHGESIDMLLWLTLYIYVMHERKLRLPVTLSTRTTLISLDWIRFTLEKDLISCKRMKRTALRRCFRIRPLSLGDVELHRLKQEKPSQRFDLKLGRRNILKSDFIWFHVFPFGSFDVCGFKDSKNKTKYTYLRSVYFCKAIWQYLAIIEIISFHQVSLHFKVNL